MKKLKKVLLYFSLIALTFTIITVLTFVGLYTFSNKAKFDIDKIKYTNTNINIYDCNNCLIQDGNIGNSFVKLNTIKNDTINAFISIEDKDFYKHHGLNYKRMTKAMIKNITALKIKEGASTISQQLIKNTHLTNERTFKRKINEIMLTKELEKKLSKNKK